MAILPGWVSRSVDPAQHRLVDALLHDLVANIVGPVHVEALLVEAETDGQRRVLDEDEVGDLERLRHPGLHALHVHRDAAGHDELPEAQVLQVQRREAAVLEQGVAPA